MSRFKWFAIGFLSIVIFSMAALWFQRDRVEKVLFDRLIQKISPSLPFQIQSYSISKNLNSLRLALRVQEQRVDLDGELHWTYLKKNGIQLEYLPLVKIEGASAFPASITAKTERDWARLDRLEFQIPANDFVFKKWGIGTKALSISGIYDDEVLKSEIKLQSLAWADALHADHAVNLTEFHLQGTFLDLQAEASANVLAEASEAEVLWEKLYLDLALRKLPLKVEMTHERRFDIRLGKNQLNAQAVLDQPFQKFTKADVNFEIGQLKLAELIPWVAKNFASFAPSLAALGQDEIKQGKLTASGLGNFQKNTNTFHLKKLNAKASSIALRSAARKMAVKSLNADVAYVDTEKMHLAHVSAKEIDYAHFTAELAPTTVRWNDSALDVNAVPLVIKNIPLTIGQISLRLQPEFDLNTSLKLSTTALAPITTGFCISPTHIPPIELSGNFTSVHVSKSMIDPTGKVEANLFDGKIELNDIGVFDLDTEVPETDFDLDWSGINLEKYGQWTHFGEIKGTLEGYAHDVVLQASLPTQYHFQVDIAPYTRATRVEYSPEAMKNTVKIFSGADLDQQIPGVANWFMFGWPSRVLGGYDVFYAGLKLTSEEGHIVVETLDKPEVVAEERKHFVLYGPRFKMPLNNSTYPLIVDATSMNNFVHQLITQLQAIKQKKEGPIHEDAQNQTCDPPEL